MLPDGPPVPFPQYDIHDTDLILECFKWNRLDVLECTEDILSKLSATKRTYKVHVETIKTDCLGKLECFCTTVKPRTCICMMPQRNQIKLKMKIMRQR